MRLIECIDFSFSLCRKIKIVSLQSLPGEIKASQFIAGSVCTRTSHREVRTLPAGAESNYEI